jgi:cation:H+ antiporter
MSTAVIWVWAEFGICAMLIAVAGSRLSRYGDVIAEKTGMGGTWIGLILLATVTSLPELITGASAVTLADVPNIAIGDALGSCVLNLMILVVLDMFSRGESIYARASHGHLLSAAFGVVLIGFVGFSVLLNRDGLHWSFFHIGLYTPILVALYLVAVRTVFRYERARQEEHVEESAARYPDITLRQAAVGYALSALVVIVAGAWLPFIGAAMAEAMGWQKSFVGTIFVAFATSVPELVVTLSALRLGALDMAVSNLLGSNLFDVLIIALDDVLYVKGPILAHVSSIHAVSAFSAVIMTGVVMVGVFYRARVRVLRKAGWVSMFLFAMYLLNTYIQSIRGE